MKHPEALAWARSVESGLALLPANMTSNAARVMLIAIAGQESDWVYRVQHGGGPARGLLQFERPGGVRAVLVDHRTKALAAEVLGKLGYSGINEHGAWEKLAEDDVLAAAFGRLFLWQHPKPLPNPRDANACWTYYLDQWRPGKPHPDRWPTRHQIAIDIIRPT